MPKLNRDEKWGRFNKKLEEFMKVGDFFGLGTTYYEMADFLKEEEKDNSHLRKLGYEMKLRRQNEELSNLVESEVKTVEILCNSDNSCEICKSQNGKIFPVEEAIKKHPIPVENCNNEYGCRCCYLSA